MRTPRRTLVLGCVLAVASAGLAQTAVPPPVKKPLVAVKVEPVLGHIPAGSAGFLVLNNVQKSVGNIEKFIDGIGMGEMIKQNMPDGLLRAALAGLNVGEGFNSAGGLAVVMLDPAKFDVDLIDMVTATTRPRATKPAKEPKLPLVIFVPGVGVQTVFANYKPVRAGKSWKIASPAGPVFARQHAGYILVSPTDKAIDAVVASRVPAARGLTAAQLAALAASDIAVYLNMDVLGPIGAKGLDVLTAEFKKMPAQPMPMDIGKIFGFYKSLLTQAKGAVITVRLTKSAAIVDELVAFKPDSLIGKAIAVAKFTKSVPLGRLPNLPYVFAANTHYAGKEANKQLMALMAPLLGEMFKGNKDAQATFDKINADSADQAQSVQIVLGGAPKDSGLFGLAYVITCKDSAKLKALTADSIGIAKTIWTSMLPKGEAKEELSKLKITYAKAVETVSGLSVDAIEIDHPRIAELDADDREKMTDILGEDKIRVFIAAVDKTTLAITFGGGKAFLAETIKTARAGGGTIPADTGVKTAISALPKNSQMVMLLSVGNLWKVVQNALTVLDADMPPINLAAKAPIAIGAKVGGTSLHAAVYMPSSVVKDIIQNVMAMGRRDAMEAPPARVTQPPTKGGEDF